MLDQFLEQSSRLSRRAIMSFLTVSLVLPGFPVQASSYDDPTARLARLFLASVIGRNKEKRLERAEQVLDEVEEKLSSSPSDPSLLMLKAAALGTAARASSFTDSVAARYGSRSDDTIEALKEIEPDHPWTLVLSGLWNFEVVRRGGSVGATMLGASVKQGEADLERAVEMIGRDDAAVSFAYAVVILSYDAEGYLDKAGTLLKIAKAVAAKQTEDKIASVVDNSASRFIGLLDTADLDTLEEEAVQGF